MRSELLPNGIDDLTDAVEDFIHGAQTVDVTSATTAPQTAVSYFPEFYYET